MEREDAILFMQTLRRALLMMLAFIDRWLEKNGAHPSPSRNGHREDQRN